MKLWNKMLDGFCLRDFNLLFESRQHNTDVWIIFSYSSEERERKNIQASGLGCLGFLFKVVFLCSIKSLIDLQELIWFGNSKLSSRFEGGYWYYWTAEEHLAVFML